MLVLHLQKLLAVSGGYGTKSPFKGSEQQLYRCRDLSLANRCGRTEEDSTPVWRWSSSNPPQSLLEKTGDSTQTTAIRRPTVRPEEDRGFLQPQEKSALKKSQFIRSSVVENGVKQTAWETSLNPELKRGPRPELLEEELDNDDLDPESVSRSGVYRTEVLLKWSEYPHYQFGKRMAQHQLRIDEDACSTKLEEREKDQ